ncbi:MAG TPA: class I SAM-dependent RNA methyltransferase, partial [Amaricoccus sp.]|nr:class I SAM-dependent RNA methyltransferase [Amaricoccus sp.]
MREVTIERLGREGDGIAGDLRLPYALPGERWAIGDGEPRLLAASTERVAPPCPHFGTCGGCALQHAADGWIADWKAGTIARALAARGIEVEIRPTLTSPPRSRRRAVFSARRTRKGANVGFHGRRSGTLVEVPHCLVVTPAIAAALPALARLARVAASRTATIRLTVTDGPAGLDVDVAGARGPDPEHSAALAAVAEAEDLARLACDGEPLAVRRPPVQVMGAARVVPPPGAFLQATAEGERALVAAVREAVGGARRVADLFAGCGTFALPLAGAAEALAVEGDPAMPAALAEAARRTPG